MNENAAQMVRSTLVSNVAAGRRQRGRLTGRTTTTAFPEGQLRREVVWEDDAARWPLAHTLAVTDTEVTHPR